MFLKDAEIGFAEINSVRIIRGILNIHTCNPILVVPPNASSTPKCNYEHKKSMKWDLWPCADVLLSTWILRVSTEATFSLCSV